MLLYTCERQALRVGVTEHLHRGENRGACVFYRLYKIGKINRKRESGKMQLFQYVSHGRAEWIRGTVLELRSKRAMSDEEGLRELNPFKSPK